MTRSQAWWLSRRFRLLVAIAFAFIILATTAWLGWRVITVASHLESARAELSQDGDLDARLDAISANTAAASRAASDPLWRAAESIPLIGDNLRAVRVSADGLDFAISAVARPIFEQVDAADSADDARPGILAASIPVVQDAAPVAASINNQLAAAAASPFLVAPVRDALDVIVPIFSTMDVAFETIPQLLGADGAKKYLLVFQNNAESLPLGGSAASQTLISADNGELSIVKQANSGSFKVKPSVEVAVDQSAIDLYSNYLVSRVNTAVARPDFQTAAQILTAFWNRDIDGTPIDGVVSINPLVLPGVLEATGPFKVNGIALNSDNVVEVLLSDSYARWGSSDKEAKKADRFFAKVAATLFKKVATGDFDPVAMMKAVAEAARTGNLLAWSNDQAIQEMINGTRVSGVMPVDNTEQTIVGVYFFDHSGGSKIDYYMDSSVGLSRTCAGGTAAYTTSARLHLDLTQEAADALPVYVNSKNWGPAKTRTGVYMYGPPGTKVAFAAVDGEAVRVLSTQIDDLGRPVAAFDVDLAPDQSATVTARFVGADTPAGPLAVWSTPMVNTTEVALDDACYPNNDGS